MSLVESQARQATSTPRFQSAGYVPEPPARAAGAALRDHVDLMLPMRHAGVRSVRVAFEAIGAADAPVVLVAGGISAHRHVAASAQFPEAGWANDLVGAGRTLDPAHRRILAFDYVGADGTLDAPIDPADQADAIAGLLDALGIDALHAFVGYSYGALVEIGRAHV